MAFGYRHRSLARRDQQEQRLVAVMVHTASVSIVAALVRITVASKSGTNTFGECKKHSHASTRRYVRMKTILVAIGFTLCLNLPANGQQISDVYSIGKTYFASSSTRAETEVMSKELTLFDNSGPYYPFVKGAQRLDLFLIHEYGGRTLKQTPPTIRLSFESRSNLSRYKDPGTGTFELTVDGRTIVQAALTLDSSTPIGFVTWENLSYDLSLAKANEL